jgi:hypothetical protein
VLTGLRPQKIEIMILKFGAIVTDGRGKIGGHVATKNRSGAILRTKVTPTNGQTSFQQGVRNLFTQLSQAWKSLTQSQRDTWNAGVTAYASTNIFGDLVNPSGANLFQKLNNSLVRIGETILDSCPAPVEVPNTSLLTITETAVTGALNLVLSNSVPAASSLLVFATAPMSQGKNFVKSEFRLIETLDAATATPVAINDAYVTKFGAKPVIGQKVFFKVVPVSALTGQQGSASSAFIIATLPTA